MKKINKNAIFEVLKEMIKEDFDEVMIGLFFLFLVWYLFLNSKMVLAFVTFIMFILTLIIYRKYFKKRKKITIKNKKHYEFLGKLLYFSILLSFFITYSISLFRIIKWSKEIPVALFYPRLILLIAIVFLLLLSFYLLRKWTFKRELFFCIISLIAVYETLIFYIVNKIYKIKPSDSDIGFYLFSIFIVTICLWMIRIDANSDKKHKNETKPKILSKK